VKITLGEGDNMAALKACITTTAASVGVAITLKAVKAKKRKRSQGVKFTSY